MAGRIRAPWWMKPANQVYNGTPDEVVALAGRLPVFRIDPA